MTEKDFIQRSAMANAASIISQSEGLSLVEIAKTSVNMAIVLADELCVRSYPFDNDHED